MCRDVKRYHSLQRCYIVVIASVGVLFASLSQLLANIAAEVFVRYLNLSRKRIFEAQTAFYDLLLGIFLSDIKSIGNIWNIDAAIKVDAGENAVAHILRSRCSLFLNYAASEYVSLAE